VRIVSVEREREEGGERERRGGGKREKERWAEERHIDARQVRYLPTYNMVRT
jgi:hypothetical protein